MTESNPKYRKMRKGGCLAVIIGFACILLLPGIFAQGGEGDSMAAFGAFGMGAIILGAGILSILISQILEWLNH